MLFPKIFSIVNEDTRHMVPTYVLFLRTIHIKNGDNKQFDYPVHRRLEST